MLWRRGALKWYAQPAEEIMQRTSGGVWVVVAATLLLLGGCAGGAALEAERKERQRGRSDGGEVSKSESHSAPVIAQRRARGESCGPPGAGGFAGGGGTAGLWH